MVFISGCARTPGHRYSFEKFSTQNKGVAILEVTVGDSSNSRSFTLKKVGNDAIYESLNDSVNSKSPFSILMLEPGIYYIDYLSLEENVSYGAGRSFSRSIKGYSAGLQQISNKNSNKYLVTIGAFEIKAGKVSYFGTLHLPKTGKFPYIITNEFDQVKTELNNNDLKDLASKLELQTFYQPGSVLIEKNGVLSFVSSEEIMARHKKKHSK